MGLTSTSPSRAATNPTTPAPTPGTRPPAASGQADRPDQLGDAARGARDVQRRLQQDAAKRPAPKPTPTAPATSTDERLEQARAASGDERARRYDRIATDLEHQGPPSRDDFRLGSRFLDIEYREAVRHYGDQLEEAQQGAKPAREARMRTELQQTAAGRELLEFERRAGVPIKVLTDREWRDAGNDPNTLAFSAGDEGLTFNVRHVNAHVYVHEMTHQVDHRTRILAPEGDGRSKQDVIDEATAKYREFGLDPTEVRAVVDATYHQPDLGHSLTHAHTRLAEARLDRQQQGGQPLTEAEMRKVLALSLPREQDIAQVARWNDRRDAPLSLFAEAQLRLYAASRGIVGAGITPEQIVERLDELARQADADIHEISRRGTG